ncbi:MAG: DUF4872 domain-containing protein [Chloroflexi bacterium]|nr:DUF4872 domain-containing protein [Chloroflexota bacterium]
MSLQPLPGFQSLKTHHCITGSMRHIYLSNGHDVSEDLLLGLGAGVSFSYWQFKGQPPFLGGRGNVGRPGELGLEKTAGQRTGVVIETQTTASASKARKALLDMLQAGQPVMVMVDMGFLPYFDFGGQEYHFGAHAVVVCGYDEAGESVLVADRDGLHPVSLQDLAKARGSTFKPFPPRNLWYTFDFVHKRSPTAEEVRQAIAEQVQPMLQPPIRNIGVPGIRKAGQMIPRWPDSMDDRELRWALFNAYIFVSAEGGTGGGCFRYMFSRFLHEGAAIAREPRLTASADDFQHIGDCWEALAEWFRQVSELPGAAAHMAQCSARFEELADLEQAAWTRLREVVQA